MRRFDDQPNRRPTIMLWGMSGSGKTSLAPLLAASVNAQCCDLDARIEAEANMSISTMFATEGEAAFRRRERAGLRRLLDDTTPDRRVIALGGGALVDDELRARALRETFVVMLRAPVETLVQRLQRASDRPLLAGDEASLSAKLTRLLNARAALYAQCHLELATNGQTLAELTAQLRTHWRAAEPINR